MSERPNLDNSIDSETFKEYYYLLEDKSLEQAIKCWKY